MESAAIVGRIESTPTATTTTVTMEPAKTTGLVKTTPASGFPSVGKKNKILKSTFRFSPLRKVAKTAKVNLNRYWGLLSHLYENSKNNSSVASAFAAEMEQNRINELLEAERENSLNSQYEEEMLSASFGPLEISSGRQRCCLSHPHTHAHAHAHSLYSSSSSIASSVQNEMDIIIMGSVESLEESFQL